MLEAAQQEAKSNSAARKALFNRTIPAFGVEGKATRKTLKSKWKLIKIPRFQESSQKESWGSSRMSCSEIVLHLVIDLHKRSNMPVAHPWIFRPCRRPSARFRLFCFPRAGAGAASFRNWAQECPEQIEIVLIQPPGREARLSEPPVNSMGELSSSIAQVIQPLLDLRYSFYGHSLGAKVAFETAREIRRLGLREPVRFFAAASSAPAVKWAHPWLHHMDDMSLLTEIHRRYGGVPQEVMEDRELCALLVPALRADLKVMETYRYTEEEPLSYPITCLAGAFDFMTPEAEVVHWGRETSAKFRLQMFPGGHFFPNEAGASLLQLMADEIALSCQEFRKPSTTL